MVKVRVTVSDDRRLQQALERLDARFKAPARPLMETLAQVWSSKFQRDIVDERLALPEHKPGTLAIRAYYGHTGKQKLVRGGDLLHSIGPLEVGDSYFESGTELDFASTLFFGGTVVEKTGRTHQVGPWPFLVVDEPLLADTDELVADYFMPPELT